MIASADEDHGARAESSSGAPKGAVIYGDNAVIYGDNGTRWH